MEGLRVWMVPMALFVVPMGACVGAMYLLQWIHRERTRRFPFTHKLMRAPGATLREKIDDGVLDFAGTMAIATAIPLFLYAGYVRYQLLAPERVTAGFRWSLIVFGTGSCMWLLVRFVRQVNAVRIMRNGLAGEMAVGEELNQLMREGYYVFHDVPGENFNIDHVLVTPRGVFAVETKVKSKANTKNRLADAKVVFDGNALYFSDRPTFRHADFLKQATDQAVWLRRWLGKAAGADVPVTPVLALPGWYVERKGSGVVRVVNPREFASMIRGTRGTLERATMTSVAYQLEQRVRDVPVDPVSRWQKK